MHQTPAGDTTAARLKELESQNSQLQNTVSQLKRTRPGASGSSSGLETPRKETKIGICIPWQQTSKCMHLAEQGSPFF